MSETLLGVIIGATIASIGPLITLFFNYHKWRKEGKIGYLKLKRDNLEKQFDECLESLSDSMGKNIYPTDMTSDIYVLFPDKVKNAFNNMLYDKDKTELAMKGHFAAISFVMKATLSEIDKKIEKEIGL